MTYVFGGDEVNCPFDVVRAHEAFKFPWCICLPPVAPVWRSKRYRWKPASSPQEMADEAPSEVLFRASKRRKILRKPAHADIESDAQAADEVITEPSLEAGSDGSSGVVFAKKKGGRGQTGINFSTNDARRAGELEPNEDRSLVVVGDEGAPTHPANDRFVKPTGRVGPTDDRHMFVFPMRSVH